MKRTVWAFVMFLVTFTFSTQCFSQDWRDDMPKPYHGEGMFVEGPALVGAGVGAVGGLIVGFIPAIGAGVLGAGTDLVMLATGNGPTNYSFAFGEEVHGVFVKGGMYAFLYIVGAPFYVVKKIFYDFPRYLIGANDALPDVRQPKLDALLWSPRLQTTRNEMAPLAQAGLC